MHAYHQLYQCKIVGGVHMDVMSLKFNPPTSQVSVIGGFHILKILGKYPPVRLMRLQISSRRTTQTSSVSLWTRFFSVVISMIKMKWIRNDKRRLMWFWWLFPFTYNYVNLSSDILFLTGEKHSRIFTSIQWLNTFCLVFQGFLYSARGNTQTYTNEK